MESELNKRIDTSTDEYILLIKELVDDCLTKFKMNLTLDERNVLIIKVYDLIMKNYVASNNTRFEENKRSAIRVIVQSCLAQKLWKDRKNL